MGLLDYIKKLVPWLKKDDIVEDVKATIDELSNIVIPSYETAITVSFKTANKDTKALTNIFTRNFKPIKVGKQAIIASINDALPDVLSNARVIETELTKYLSKDVIAEGLEAKRAVLVRAADHLSFISKYSIDILNTLYAFEISNTTNNVEINSQLINYVNSNLATYCALLSAYDVNTGTMIKNLDSIPDLILSDGNALVVDNTYSSKLVDPFLSNMTSGFIYNPIYHLRIQIAEYQAYRYKTIKEKKKALELRVLYLKGLIENKADPKLEQEIAYQQSRIETMDYKLSKIDRRLGI